MATTGDDGTPEVRDLRFQRCVDLICHAPALLAIARRQAPTLPSTCGDVLAVPYRRGDAAATIAWYSLHNLHGPRTRPQI